MINGSDGFSPRTPGDYAGITQRDFIAISAMQMLLVKDLPALAESSNSEKAAIIADMAYRMSDAMIARSK